MRDRGVEESILGEPDVFAQSVIGHLDRVDALRPDAPWRRRSPVDFACEVHQELTDVACWGLLWAQRDPKVVGLVMDLVEGARKLAAHLESSLDQAEGYEHFDGFKEWL